MAKESDIKPFEKGDVLVGATLLNDPDDDHAGDGRIIQYDNNLPATATISLASTLTRLNCRRACSRPH